MIENGILAAAAFVLLGAAYSDLKQFKIPNLMPALLLALYGCYVAIVGLSAFSWWHAAHFAIALIVGMALFAMKWFGGGDAKLYAAVALWFPLQKGPLLLLYVGMAGLVLAIMFMHTCWSDRLLAVASPWTVDEDECRGFGQSMPAFAVKADFQAKLKCTHSTSSPFIGGSDRPDFASQPPYWVIVGCRSVSIV